MTIYEVQCPGCQTRILTDEAYLTCARCQTFFYIDQGVRPLHLPEAILHIASGEDRLSGGMP